MNAHLWAAHDARRHVTYKLAVRELTPDVGQRMLATLDDLPDQAQVDYARLLEQATFPPPPSRCYHTAPRSVRSDIERDGLLPGSGRNWPHVTDQPEGVYVGATPDERGVWAHEETWDIWEVDMTDLRWDHDRLNPGCWRLEGPVGRDRVTRWERRPDPSSVS